ncbi:hypothetical protein [Chlorobium phaeobacteroides]|jgi:hypothetical protein|nr:hypothetical protein [Chlorobium phaeobacteroides]MBV5326714.1 hypothetical protein [Chlorobium sp.]
MPLGHAAVIFLQHALGNDQVVFAGLLLGLTGAGLLLLGMYASTELIATFPGMFCGLFVWTGWIEIGFEYYAKRLGIEPVMLNGEIVTKAEYLLMPSSVGFFAGGILSSFGAANNAGFCSFRKAFLLSNANRYFSIVAKIGNGPI